MDFDNTITVGDVGDALFLKFGGEQTLRDDQQYRDGIISAKECIRKKCRACGAIDRHHLETFIHAQAIDVTFPEFVRFCTGRGYSYTVVSDGFDYYIQRIFGRNGLVGVPVFANELTLEPVEPSIAKVTLVPSFPYDDEECTRCGCCKRNVLLSHSSEDDVIVYIGDGYSDQCPVLYADIVFAKAELQAFCQSQNISYYEYRSFHDVRKRLESLATGTPHRLRKRKTAEANRQALYLAG